MSFFSPLLLFLLIFLPGFASWSVFNDTLRLKLSGLETIFIWLLTGTAVISWLSLTLAEFGLFSLPLLLVFVLVPGGLMISRVVWQGRFKAIFSGLSWHWQDGVVGLLLLVGVLLSGRPSEYIVGGRDHGVYVNTGIHIAKTGSIIVKDDEMATVPAELRTALVLPETRTYQAGFPGPWSEGQRIGGLTIRDLAAGIYLPHAFHLYSALIAVFFAIGSVPFALLTTMFLALLGSLAIYAATARIWGRSVGLLALLLLTFSVTQVWFTGYPTAEIMVQVFFWGGLFALTLLLESGEWQTAVLAGSCFGLLHLTKLDTVLIPVTIGALFLYLWLRNQFKPAYWWSIAIYLLLSLQALLHASFIATIYFLDHAIRNLLPGLLADPLVVAADGHPYPADWLARFFTGSWPLLLLLAAVGLGSLVLLYWLRPILGRLLDRVLQHPNRWQQGIVGLVLVLVVGTAVSDQFFTIPTVNNTMQAVQLSRLYLTRAGLLAAGVGWLLLIYQANSTPKFAALFLLAGNIAPLFILGAGTTPDHFWVIRRFIPIVFPAFLLAMAWTVWCLWSYQQHKWPQATWGTKVLALGLVVVVLAGSGQHLRFIAGVVEYDGLTEQLEKLVSSLPEESVLLIETANDAQRLGLPLWFIFDKTVFTIQSEVREDLRLKTAVANWLANGRQVFWLAANNAAPPNWSEGQRQLAFKQTIDVPLMETPTDHIPRQINRFQVAFDVYQINQP